MLKAIFCINPGRSGSHYLAGLLAEAKNCESNHESDPTGFGFPLQSMAAGYSLPMREVAEQKCKDIARANRSGLIYCDTSHCFIKGFGWYIMQHFEEEDVGVVILKRDKKAVVDSTFRAGSGPLRNLGKRYILTPATKSPITAPPSFLGLPDRLGFLFADRIFSAVKFLSRIVAKLGLTVNGKTLFAGYERTCIAWYWDETYALGEKFRKRFPNCRYIEINTEDMNDIRNVLELFRFLDLVPNNSLDQKVGVKTNLKL